MVGLVQSRNRLENGRGKDDKMSRGVWKAVEANIRKIRIAETEGRRSKEESRKKMKRESREKRRSRKKER